MDTKINEKGICIAIYILHSFWNCGSNLNNPSQRYYLQKKTSNGIEKIKNIGKVGEITSRARTSITTRANLITIAALTNIHHKI